MSGVFRWSESMSLRWRLTLIIMISSLVAMTVAMGVFIYFDSSYFRDSLRKELGVNATIASSQVEAALLFDDAREANKILQGYGAAPHILRIVIYDAVGSVFALYHPPHLIDLAAPRHESLQMGINETERGYAYVRPIEVEGERIGWIYLESDQTELKRRQQWYIPALAGMALIFSLTGFLFSFRLQEAVSGSIGALAQLARQVSREQDYHLRAEGNYSHEIGDLYASFNAMLSQIESQNERLARHADDLARTVELRTAELKEVNENLKRELEDRRAAEESLRESERKINIALKQAVSATQVKDKFVSLVSHDLRSPLAGVLGMVEILRDETTYRLSPAERMTSLAKIHGSLSSQLELINRLLDISRLQSGNIEIHKRFLEGRPLVMSQFERVEMFAQRKGIHLVNDVPADTRLLADPILYAEVIYNLVNNSVKFCAAGDTIRVYLPDDRPHTLAVSDTGPGIAAPFAPNLFRHDIRTTGRGSAGETGTGLGLPYCHDIMRAHGGALTVKSQEGEGATFYVTLPTSRMSVLVVEDIPLHRTLIARLVEMIGDIEVREAEDGVEALERLKEYRPDLIVTDLLLPRMDGYAFIERIRSNPQYDDIPIIVVSGGGEGEEAEVDGHMRERVFTLGANDFVSKPLTPDDFIPRARRFLHPV
ncbi:MAG: response regulator [Nitrospinae bacterium]|nr:response regulator [Nitrospinota bacterium]